MPLKVSDGIGAWIKDFRKSDAPQFKGKSEKERRQMAIAAYLDARDAKNESFQEDTTFKVNIDGLPMMFMSGASPGEVKAKLRGIVKQPSMIKDVDRVTDAEVKKTFRLKAQGRDEVEEEYKYDYGSPESIKLMKKITPGQNEKTYMRTDPKLKNLKVPVNRKKGKILNRKTGKFEGISEESKHEITVGDYTTKFFHMCGSAQKVMKKNSLMPGAEALTKMQDNFYEMEKNIMKAGGPTEDQKKMAMELYNEIMAKAGEVGLADDIDDYMKMHIDSITKGKPKLGFGRTDVKESLSARIIAKYEEVQEATYRVLVDGEGVATVTARTPNEAEAKALRKMGVRGTKGKTYKSKVKVQKINEGMKKNKKPESFEAQFKRRVVKTTKPEHKAKGYNWRIKGKERPEISIKLYKNKPGQAEFNKQLRRVAGHEFGG